MADYSAYVLHTNRPDLTEKALLSLRDIWKRVAIIDNSGEEFGYGGLPVVRAPVPMTAVQSINTALTLGKKAGNRFVLWMHNDAEAHPGSAVRLVEYARRLLAEGRKWGVLFTNYDALSAINLATVEDVGLWDTFFSAYFSDNDWLKRVLLAGWECIDTGIPVDHVGSQTINSDPDRKFMNSITFPIYAAYYEKAWGGPPGHETFTKKFNRG